MFPIKTYCLRLGKTGLVGGNNLNLRLDRFYFQMQIITTAS